MGFYAHVDNVVLLVVSRTTGVCVFGGSAASPTSRGFLNSVGLDWGGLTTPNGVVSLLCAAKFKKNDVE